MIKILITGYEQVNLTDAARRVLESNEKIIFHTARCEAAQYLATNGFEFSSFDCIYEGTDDFDEHKEKVLKLLEEETDCVYCVMDAGDETAKAYVKRHPRTEIIAPSPDDALLIHAEKPVLILNAIQTAELAPRPDCSVLVKEIDSRFLASEVKLRLSEVYGDEADTYLRSPDGKLAKISLEVLDRLKNYDHRCACLINPPEVPFSYTAEMLGKLVKRGNTGYEAISEDELAKRLADVIKCVKNAEAHGEYTLSDVLYDAAELLKSGE